MSLCTPWQWTILSMQLPTCHFGSILSADTQFDFENDVDPVSHVFNRINDSCRHFTEEQLNDRINLAKTFSLLHISCRSLLKNFTKTNEYLETFEVKFNGMALSETWINKGNGFT